MKDERIQRLAYNLVNYSCDLKEGEKVLIRTSGDGSDKHLVLALIDEIYKVKALPFVWNHQTEIIRDLLKNSREEQIKLWSKVDLALMSEMDAYIGVASSGNNAELSSVGKDKLDIYQKYYINPVHMEIRVKKTKWVILRYPNYSMAQLASKSTDEFEDFFFKVCTLDYAKMSKAMDVLADYMNKTDKVRIVGEGTDLTFSIKDIPSVKCDGHRNIPDGEVYTAPVRDSINGVISYNTPSLYNDGFTYTDIRFEFENGKIVKATSNDNERINKILDSDEGSRYIGEFAIGVNPYITDPMKDTLFDEKIMGSFHLTPGNCYEEASNGNDSVIHWDLVCIQTEQCGGGEIYFDDKLIRKNGIFVVEELFPLNPENLK